ncbi:MAG TPA: mycofactocin biosynthesis peptidyl-dipeptidase MftE [Solirubrobacterales bacterium]|jgi:creatinine amidohydrolase
MSGLADLTSPEVERGRLLIVPLGATEQHGPHLPLGTDSEIADAIARLAAARLAGAFVAPTLPYGSSGEHQDFAGTLSIGAAATELVLVEVGRSATETFDRVLFLNAHGGNAGALAAAVGRLRDEGRDVRAWSPRWGGDAHAGRTETSLMLALMPRRVRDGREPGNTAPLAALIDDLRAEGVRPLAPNGVLGDPTVASAGEGAELLAAAVEDLRALLLEWPDPVVVS